MARERRVRWNEPPEVRLVRRGAPNKEGAHLLREAQPRIEYSCLLDLDWSHRGSLPWVLQPWTKRWLTGQRRGLREYVRIGGAVQVNHPSGC